MLKVSTAVDATPIAAQTLTKNKDLARDPEMHSSKKGKQWYFAIKAHIGVDAESGLVHTVCGTSGHVSEIAEANSSLHGDAGYQGFEKRPNAKADVIWYVAMRPGKRRALNKENAADAMIDQAEKLKAGIRGQSRAFPSGDQAPIRICQISQSRFEEKHDAADEFWNTRCAAYKNAQTVAFRAMRKEVAPVA